MSTACLMHCVTHRPTPTLYKNHYIDSKDSYKGELPPLIPGASDALLECVELLASKPSTSVDSLENSSLSSSGGVWMAIRSGLGYVGGKDVV